MSSTWTTVELARLYEAQGYHGDALNHYRRLLEADPSSREAAEGVERLSRLEEQAAPGRPGEPGEGPDGADRIRRLAEQWAELVIHQVFETGARNVKELLFPC